MPSLTSYQTFTYSDLMRLQNEFNFSASTWVKLRELPSPYSFDEALLLCEDSQGYWLTWVPDFGEVKLHPSQFSKIDSN